jgi:hypothetical protein
MGDGSLWRRPGIPQYQPPYGAVMAGKPAILFSCHIGEVKTRHGAAITAIR